MGPVRAGLMAPGSAVWRQPCLLGTGSERVGSKCGAVVCPRWGRGHCTGPSGRHAGQRPLVESATFWGRASWLREPCPLSLARHPLTVC